MKILSLSNLSRFLSRLEEVFAKTSDLAETKESLQTQITANAETAQEAQSAAASAQSAANSASSTASTASSNASTALSRANEATTFIDAYFTEDSDGINVEGASSYGLLSIGSSIDVDGSHNDFTLRRTGGLSEAGYYKAFWTLYYNSSGTTGTVSLSTSAAKFDEILIIFKDSDGNQNSAIVRKGSSSTVYASLLSAYMNPGVYFEHKVVAIGTTSITNYAGGRSYVSIGGANYNAAEATTYISITAVYGLHT